MRTTTGGWRRIAWILFVACTFAGSSPAWCAPEYRSVTILHTNDTHGHLIPFSLPDPPNPDVEYAGMPVIKDIGGIARRASLARRIEAETRGNALLVDAGDALDGTPFSIEYMGEADFAAMSAAGYDVMTPGNHEFSASLQEFWRNVRLATFPLVSANIVDRQTGKPALPPYVIVEMDGVKMAFFGLTIPNKYRAAKEGFDFRDPIEAAKELVPALRQQADVVVALAHLSEDDLTDFEGLAREVPGIDAIVSGHTHKRLATPVLIKTSDEPRAFSVGGTILVQDYWWAGELGRLDLVLRRDGGPFTLMSYKGRLIPVTSDIPDDPATAAVVDKYYKPISKHYGEVIGEATACLYHDYEGDSTMLNLICDAMREGSGAQVAVYNTGGVRGDLDKGPIKVWDIATILPFKNKLVQIEISGGRLKEALEKEKPGVSGVRYRIEGGKLVEATVAGKPVDDSAVYTVATSDFLLGSVFSDVTNHKVLSDDYRTVVVDYIRTHKAISPVADGRRIIEP
jgi:2',3'-cyclic-nucleotide 2'-phosphodiesterase (5'-nucleotidase family)